jgi:hypothetical protein
MRLKLFLQTTNLCRSAEAATRGELEESGSEFDVQFPPPLVEMNRRGGLLAAIKVFPSPDDTTEVHTWFLETLFVAQFIPKLVEVTIPTDVVTADAIHLFPSAEQAAEFQFPEKFVIQFTPAFVEVNRPENPPPTSVLPSAEDAINDMAGKLVVTVNQLAPKFVEQVRRGLKSCILMKSFFPSAEHAGALT